MKYCSLILPPSLFIDGAAHLRLKYESIDSSSPQESEAVEMTIIHRESSLMLRQDQLPESILYRRGEEWLLVQPIRIDHISLTQAFLQLTRYIYNEIGRYTLSNGLNELRENSNLFLDENHRLYSIYYEHLRRPECTLWDRSGFSESFVATNQLWESQRYIREILNLSSLVGHTGDLGRIAIVIPIYGKILYTLRCIRSILRDLFIDFRLAFSQHSVQIIIIDDHSPNAEGREQLVNLADNNVIHLITNHENLGFLRSCNKAMSSCESVDYVCLLNNDTEVTPGWLSNLLATFIQFPNTGLVGSQLLYPNATLQEAGGIVWSDGSAWNYGRGQDVSRPEFNYCREVDYISGASVMIPSAILRQINGFDDRYAPAYYEDTDLAFQIRSDGYRVLYQPLSKVIHYEGISSGTDISTGIKRFQVINQGKFYEKWHSYLDTRQANAQNIRVARNCGCIGHVLVVELLLLSPDVDAGSAFIFDHCLCLQHLGYEVSYLPADNFCYQPDHVRRMQSYGIHTLYSPYYRSIDEIFEKNPEGYDFIIVARPENAGHIPLLKRLNKGRPILYFTHDLHHRRYERERMAGISNVSKDLIARTYSEEFDIFSSVDGVLHISQEEKDYSLNIQQHVAHVLAPALIVGQQPIGDYASAGIVFVGSSQHPPNKDGLLWFIQEVFPSIQNICSNSILHVVGMDPPKEIRALESHHIHIHGFVLNLEDIFSKCSLGIAPLLYGAGVKGKVLKYLAAGLPCVATEIATEGISPRLNQKEGTDPVICVADSPRSFADCCVRLLLDPDYSSELGGRAQKSVERAFGAKAVVAQWIRILEYHHLPFAKPNQPIRLYSPVTPSVFYRRDNSLTPYNNN